MKIKFDYKYWNFFDYVTNTNIDILENINCKELKEFDLSDSKISDIKVLEKLKFEKSEKINLGYNKISNIDILENVNFKELKEFFK